MKQPYVASLDQVRVLRDPDGETAIIDYAEDNVMRVHLRIGPEVRGLTDQQIIDRHNAVIEAQAELRGDYEHVAVEIPIGKPQIKYEARAHQWVPRGGVLRVVIDDEMDSDGDPAFVIDDTELTVRESTPGTAGGSGSRSSPTTSCTRSPRCRSRTRTRWTVVRGVTPSRLLAALHRKSGSP